MALDGGNDDETTRTHRDDRGAVAGEVTLARVAGFPVAIDWSVLVIVWLLAWGLATQSLPQAAPGYSAPSYWIAGFGGAFVLVGSLLVHELAHALAAKRAGIEVTGLTLWVFGGVARLDGEPRTPEDDLRIAVVGPATSFALGIAFGVAAVAARGLSAGLLTASVLTWLAAINVVLALFNLIPGAPLDGGRVLRAVLWHRGGNRLRAAVSATRAGRAVAVGLIGLGLLEFLAGAGVGGLWFAFIGWFLLNAARSEETAEVVGDALAGVTIGDAMTRHPQTVPASLTIDAFVEGHLLGDRHSSYPVADAHGEIVGLVTLTQLRAVPPANRNFTRLIDVAVPLSSVPVAAPDDRLVTVLGQVTALTGGRALVFEGGQLVGILTPTDVTRVIDLQSLRTVSGR